MAADKHTFSLASVEKILRKAGSQRNSEDAKAALSLALEEIALEISKRALDLASHAGRRTVMGKDIYLASKETKPLKDK